MGESLLVVDLAREIADGQVMAVIGAGVAIAASSGGAVAASWTGLLVTAVERCEHGRWLQKTVRALELRDTAVAKTLAALGAPLVTTNYDDLLEEVTGLEPVTWRDAPRAQAGPARERALDCASSRMLADPASVALGDPAAQALLRALVTFRSFFLVRFGARLNDSTVVDGQSA